jgi:hypothetical protein
VRQDELVQVEPPDILDPLVWGAQDPQVFEAGRVLRAYKAAKGTLALLVPLAVRGPKEMSDSLVMLDLWGILARWV